jgi:hypothetical protein
VGSRDVPQSATTGRTFLLVIGDREALAWVLSSGRMAFPDLRRSETRTLTAGDRLLIYTTRGCFKNPTRDRGRIIGEATVTTAVAELEDPVAFGGRSFPAGCGLRIESLAPLGAGVDLAEYVSRLDAFPHPDSWSIQLRRPLLTLSAGDALLLGNSLRALTRTPAEAMDGYLRWLPSATG